MGLLKQQQLEGVAKATDGALMVISVKIAPVMKATKVLGRGFMESSGP